MAHLLLRRSLPLGSQRQLLQIPLQLHLALRVITMAVRITTRGANIRQILICSIRKKGKGSQLLTLGVICSSLHCWATARAWPCSHPESRVSCRLHHRFFFVSIAAGAPKQLLCPVCKKLFSLTSNLQQTGRAG